MRDSSKTINKVSVRLIADMLCMIDAREAGITRTNTYLNEQAMSSDPAENRFGTLVGLAGYSPTAAVTISNLQKIEDEAQRSWNPKHTLLESRRKKRHTPLQKHSRRAEWNSGQRLKWWWPARPLNSGDMGPAVRPGKAQAVTRSHVRERAARRCGEGKRTTVRDFFLAKSYNSIANIG